MAEFTLDDVRRILRECAGEADSVSLDEEIGHLSFEEMGYDSLARMELAARIQQEFPVVIPDEAVDELPTPQAVINYVNPRLAAV